MNARPLAALVLALSAGTALALPAVWWEPLHLDEAITLEFSQRSYGSIVRDIFVERGGAPTHFAIEHIALAVSGGIEGLRLPSVFFFLVTIVLTAQIAQRLAGRGTALLSPIFVAVAPLGLGLATFARMYSLFVAAVLATTLLALRAAWTTERRDWVLAGAAAGALVYVHPIAPLYASLAVATGLLVAERPWRKLVREAWPGVAVAIVVAAPYAYALAVLRSRYDVLESGRIRTTAGRSVPEEALHAVTAGGTSGALALLALATVGLLWLRTRRPRASIALALWLIVPMAFFALVPASTRFFGRYVAPAEPMFYLLVAAGCLAIARHRRYVAAALALGVVALSVSERVDRLQTMRDLGLRDLVAAVGGGSVVFSSTGTPISDRPPELLDDYLDLEGPPFRRVEELPGIDLRFEPNLEARGAAGIASFVEADVGGTGTWVFRGPERRIERAILRLGDSGDLGAEQVSPTLLLVRSRTPAAPSVLLEQGIRARTAWTLDSPADRWTRLLLRLSRNQRRTGSNP